MVRHNRLRLYRKLRTELLQARTLTTLHCLLQSHGLASQHINAWEMLASCWDQCSGFIVVISRLCGLYGVVWAV